MRDLRGGDPAINSLRNHRLVRPKATPTTRSCSTHRPHKAAHICRKHVSLWCRSATARPLAAVTQNVLMCGSRASHVLLGWGKASRCRMALSKS
eukprot:4884554-Prymnesium_polylepis.1